VRKRLADHLSDDTESAGVACKRMCRISATGRRLARTSRPSDTQVTELHDSATKIRKTVVGPSGSNLAPGIVKSSRGRGRPCKVSCLWPLYNV